MTKKERNHIYYINAKKNNICWSCKREKDRDGYYCSDCLKKRSQKLKSDKIFYRDLMICPLCKKNTLYGEEKTCVECKAKEAERINRIRERDREEYNRKHREYQKKIYSERIENGLCTNCGKRRSDEKYKMCQSCREKKVRSNAYNLKRDSKIIQGICYFCSNEVKNGYKVCEYHYEKCVANLKNDAVIENRKKIKKQR